MASQTERSLDDMDRVPPTVYEHTREYDGMTLHTRGDTHDSDIRIYNDGRPPNRVGHSPEKSE